jgi:pyruvate dehydrogenase E1 component alpha subunit
MPRQAIASFRVEYLQVLDENANIDSSLDPQVPAEDLRRMYRTMLLTRVLDRRLVNLQQQGRIGTFPSVMGQEACVGCVYPLWPTDWLVPSFRENAALFWRGLPIKNLLIYFMGLEEGNRFPEEQKALPIAITVGSQPLHATGIAWAAQLRGEDTVAMVFFGDGATSEGDFHEACNMAGVFRVPVIFVCINNQYAISLSRAEQTRSETLAQKAWAYGFPGIQIDGNDPLACCVAAREAIARARAGEGPTLIECLTYRLGAHTSADDPRRYRAEEEVQVWQRRDPLGRFRKYLENKGLWTESWQARLEEEIKAEIDEAIQEAELEREHVDPLEMFDHVYGELPPDLQAQKEQAAGFIAQHAQAHAGNGRP